MEVVVRVERARDVGGCVARHAVAVARRVEVGEVRTLRRERGARNRIAHRCVERDDLRVLRGVVGDIDDRSRDELRVRLAVQRLPHEVRPHGEELFGGGVVGIDVVRANLGEDEIDVAGAVEHRVDGVDRAAAALCDETLSADAGVPHPLLGHHRAADVVALDLPVSLRDGRVTGGGKALHQEDAPVAVGGVAALRDGVARAEHVDALLRFGVVEVEPEASAAGKVLGPNLHVRTVRARRVEHGVERSGVHFKRAPIPRHQEEAPLRRRGVVGRERDLRARGEYGRRDEAERELHGIEYDLTRRAHVESVEVEPAHRRERCLTIDHQRRRAERDRIPADVGERLACARGQKDAGVRKRSRHGFVLRPVADCVERRVRRTRPEVVRYAGARGLLGVLHPELNADVGVRPFGDVVHVGSRRVAVGIGPVKRLCCIIAVIAVVGERAHAERTQSPRRSAPAVEGKEDFRSRKRIRLRELPHDLETGMAASATGGQRVVEAERTAPRFRDYVTRALGLRIVHGIELKIAIHGVVVGRHLRDAAAVAPHVEFRDRHLLALRVRNRERHVGPCGTGRVHVDPQRPQRAGVLAHQLDVVAGLRDVRFLHRRSVGIGNLINVLRKADGLVQFNCANAREARKIRRRDVVRGVEDDRRRRPRGRRVLARCRRERHELRLDRGGHGIALRICLRRRDGAGDIDALDIRLRRAPRRDVGVERRRGLDARHGRLVVGEHRRVGDAVGDINVAAQEDGEVGIVRRRAVRLEAFENARARSGRLEREIDHARMALPGVFGVTDDAGTRRTPARHLHFPPLCSEERTELGAVAVVVRAIDVSAAHVPDLDRVQLRDGSRSGMQHNAAALVGHVVVIWTPDNVDDSRARARQRACREERHVRASRRSGRSGVEVRQVERHRRRDFERARECAERKRPRVRGRARDTEIVVRRMEQRAAVLHDKTRHLERRGVRAEAHVQRAARVDRDGNCGGGNRDFRLRRGGGGVHHHRAAEDLRAGVHLLVGMVVLDVERARAVLQELRIRAVAFDRRIERHVSRLVGDDNRIRNIDPLDIAWNKSTVKQRQLLNVCPVLPLFDLAAVQRGDGLERGLLRAIARDAVRGSRAVYDHIHIGKAHLLVVPVGIEDALLHVDRSGRRAVCRCKPEPLVGRDVDRERVAVQVEARRRVVAAVDLAEVAGAAHRGVRRKP